MHQLMTTAGLYLDMDNTESIELPVTVTYERVESSFGRSVKLKSITAQIFDQAVPVHEGFWPEDTYEVLVDEAMNHWNDDEPEDEEDEEE